jgi:EmrB/QacA subfamily drug resistance transporter
MDDAMQLPNHQKALALVGVLLGMLLAALDNTIVATAGPSIQSDLHIEAGLYVWITTSYLVSSTVLVPIWGKLSDTIGRRRVLLAGIGLFLVGSMLCGLAQNATQLILFRAVQGMGSASLFTSAFAIVGDMYSPRERGRLNGFFGAVFGMSSVIGPLVGGFITDNFGWNWCFYVNVPVGIIAILFILSRMPPLLPREDKPLHLDVVGALMLSIGVVPLLIALSLGKAVVRAGETGFVWTSWQELALLGVAVVGIALFMVVERRARDPIVDLKLFKNTAFARGAVASFAAGLTFLAAAVFLPLFMQRVVGEKATGAGLTTLPLTAGIVVANITSGIASTKTGKYKPFLLLSLGWSTIAFAILAFMLDVDATKLSVSWKMFLIGLGLGPSIPLFALAVQNSVPPHLIGVASSMATFSRQMGAVIGIAIFGTVFATTLADELEAKIAEATKDVPPQFKSQLQPGASSSGEEGAAQPRDFDKAAIEQKVHDNFAKQRALVKRALVDADPQAMAELAKQPGLDEQQKNALEHGGVAAAVKAGFAAESAKVKAAIEAGPDAVTALANDPSTPPQLAEKLKAIPGPALANPDARAQIEAGVEQGMNAAADAMAKDVTDKALTGANNALDVFEKVAIDTVGRIDAAMKRSFTDAVKKVYFVAIFFALFGFLCTLPLPALPLRARGGGGAPE